LKRVNGIAITRLTSSDVVRHPLVARIVDAYDRTPSDIEEVSDAINTLAGHVRKTRAKGKNGS
jgi:phosphate starvation-inducible PhoH-like protein